MKSILKEDKRSQLIANSKTANKEKGDGKTRYEKRLKSRVASSTKNYNKIDMDSLFKKNILTVNIDVHGETDDYVVTISFGGFLDEIHKQLKTTDDEFNLRVVIRALVNAFNSDNVYIRCSCADFHYRFGWWLSKNDIIYGDKETIPSDITNPDDNLGSGCKHILLTLSNHSWLIKVASVVVNYVKYMQKHYEKLYKEIIYPALYSQDFIEIEDELESDEDTINKSNDYAKTKNQFKPGNEFRYPKGWNTIKQNTDTQED